jgi:hypothetical protein
LISLSNIPDPIRHAAKTLHICSIFSNATQTPAASTPQLSDCIAGLGRLSRSFAARGTSKTGSVHRYYACSTCARKRKTACKRRSMLMDKLDNLVTTHMTERLF